MALAEFMNSSRETLVTRSVTGTSRGGAATVPRIVADPPLLVPVTDLVTSVSREEFMNSARAILRGYRRSLQRDRGRLLESYRVVDVARKVVGVGSVRTRTIVALLLGRDDQDPLFLQVKEARDSVLAPFVGRSLIKNQGQRVVE